MRRPRARCSLAAVALLTPAIAAADPPPRATVHHAAGTRSEASGTIIVHGIVQRPQAFDLSGRAASGYQAVDTAPHFTPQVMTATRRNPF